MPVGLIPRERLAAIIERELPFYGGDMQGDPRNAPVSQAGPLEAMAAEIALSTGRTPEAVKRHLYRIRSGNAGTYRGRRLSGDVTFSTADEILSALGLPHLWHTELADLYEAA